MSALGEIQNDLDAPTPLQTPGHTSPAPAGKRMVTVIKARPGWHLVDLNDLWRYREVFYTLVWRDIKVRYKQTALGATWAVFQPLVTMLAFSIFLGKVAAKPGSGVPYPLFVFMGLVPWLFLSNSIAKSSENVVANQNLVTKIYFPRILLPLSAVGVGLVDFSVSFGLLLVMMLAFGFVPGPGILLVPLMMLILVATAMGVGSVLSTLMVSYRDFRSLVPLMLQVWMFATPAIYLQAGEVYGPRGQAFLLLNPASGAIDNLRRALLGRPLDWPGLAVSSAVSVLLLAMGVLCFQRFERRFSDII